MGSVGYQRHRPEQTLLYQIVERQRRLESMAIFGEAERSH